MEKRPIYLSKIQREKSDGKQSIFIIAEMAWAHDGLIHNAKKIVKGAADAGADAISIHITHLQEYMAEDYGSSAGQTLSAGKETLSVYDYLRRINLTDKDWHTLFSYARSLGLGICAMPNDFRSLRLCKKLKPDMYVIHASSFTEEQFVRAVGSEKKPVILRIGGAFLGEIERTVNLLKKQGVDEIILLHGIQLYPTKVEDMQLNILPSLKSIFRLTVGLADHIDADSPLALILPLLAIPLGATVIEKHITYDRSKKGEDFEAALNPDEFKTFVGYLRAAQNALGTTHFRDLSKSELTYRNVARKKTLAAKDIKRGEKIKISSITFKRSDKGMTMEESKYVIGMRAKRDIRKNEPILWHSII